MEEYKSLDQMLNPDSRWRGFALINRQTGETRPMTLADHYEKISDFKMDASVPETIRSQFNISKNLLAYSWFVYAFFSVAEMHATTVLELALKTRMGDAGMGELKRMKKPRGLFSYIEFARDKGWIRNEDFSAYHRAPFNIAQDKYLEQKREEMRAKGLNEIELNYGEIDVPTENTTDYIAILLETVNFIRNSHTHGEIILYPASTWQSFEICSDFVNALYRGS